MLLFHLILFSFCAIQCERCLILVSMPRIRKRAHETSNVKQDQDDEQEEEEKEEKEKEKEKG